MKRRRFLAETLGSLTVWSLAPMSIAAPAVAPALGLVSSVPLPDVKGRIDHLAADPKGHRLFVAALGNDTVEVIDTRNNGRRTIRGLGEPQGVLYLPDQDLLVIANGRAGRVDFVELTTLDTVARVPDMDDADNVRWYSPANAVLVGYGRGALRMLDVAGKPGMDIRLPGHPESFQIDPGKKRAYVNVPSAHAVVVVDLETGRATTQWPTPQASANFPMSLDLQARRLFVGTRSPALLLVYDLDTGNVVTRLPIGGDTDDVYFDAQRKRIYVICGGGRVDLIRQETPDRYVAEQSVETSPGARTGLFVAEEGRLYVAARASANLPARLLTYRVN
jgi:YVTN family beta-propeller protein